jgi:hypothetical protein
MIAAPVSDFDPDFAGPAEWAAMYRACGLQIIPCHMPKKDTQWKRPALADWRDLQRALVSDAGFARWYGADGAYVSRRNMGIITGQASGRIMVVDLDSYKTPAAKRWWDGLLAVENNNLDLETVEQRTGGGGRQKLFRYPAGWHAPTNRTAIGVDIRGQGGFAVMAPSLHESGQNYEWLPGRAPWEIEIADAPQWLLDAIEALVEAYGGDQGTSGGGDGHRQHTASPASDYDGFGNYQDGREVVMFRTVWREVLEWYRECPIRPPEVQWQARAEAAYLIYERKVTTRIAGGDKRAGLEQEGRGPTAFWRKWGAAMRHWGSPRMVDDAASPPRNPPHDEQPDPFDPEEFAQASERAEEKAKADPGALFEYLDIRQIKALADPFFLIAGLVIERSLGFLYGPPGCLKTFIALDMGLSFALRRQEWWGRRIERGGAVVYISSEGQSDLKFRIAAWELRNGIEADSSPFYLIRETINFMKPEDVGRLLATVAAIADLAQTEIVAVFVDTVSRVLPGADENLQKDMTLFVAACDAVRQRFGATVIGVHHTSRAGNMRGSTVFPGGADFMVEVEREEGAKHGLIRARKIKAAEDGWVQHFVVEEVPIGDIGGHTSLVVEATVVEATVVAPPPSAGGWPSKAECQIILTAIDEAWRQGLPWSPFPQTRKQGRYAPSIMGRMFKIEPPMAAEMIETWIINKVLALEVYDTDSRSRGLRVIGSIS